MLLPQCTIKGTVVVALPSQLSKLLKVPMQSSMASSINSQPSRSWIAPFGMSGATVAAVVAT